MEQALRHELVSEEDLSDDVRALAGDLLADCFGVPDARERAWIHHPPAFRALIWDGDILVGNEMGCLLESSPPLVVYGIGDAAVREGWRGRGIAKDLGLMTTDEGVRRQADALLCSTVHLGHYIVVERGWVPIEPGELYLRRHLLRRRLIHNWYAKWIGPKVVPLTIRKLF